MASESEKKPFRSHFRKNQDSGTRRRVFDEEGEERGRPSGSDYRTTISVPHYRGRTPSPSTGRTQSPSGRTASPSTGRTPSPSGRTPSPSTGRTPSPTTTCKTNDTTDSLLNTHESTDTNTDTNTNMCKGMENDIGKLTVHNAREIKITVGDEELVLVDTRKGEEVEEQCTNEQCTNENFENSEVAEEQPHTSCRRNVKKPGAVGVKRKEKRDKRKNRKLTGVVVMPIMPANETDEEAKAVARNTAANMDDPATQGGAGAAAGGDASGYQETINQLQEELATRHKELDTLRSQMDNLRSQNLRLKDENSALLRVVGSLSGTGGGR